MNECFKIATKIKIIYFAKNFFDKKMMKKVLLQVDT